MSLRLRRALVGLFAVVAALALPAAASAAITPTLALNQSAGTTAGSSPAIGFDAKFAPTLGDSPKDVTLSLPTGLLANANLAGGACLLATTPQAPCQVGSGTVTTGAGAAPVSLYLVKAPQTTDAAGVALVEGSSPSGTPLGTGDVIVRTTPDFGLDLKFSNLPNLAVSEINVSLTNLRLPTSCPTLGANVTLTADSAIDPTAKTATAPLTVTGCTGLAYNPKLTATATKDKSGQGVEFTSTITQAATEAASKTIVLGLPKSLVPNVAADVPCLSGTPCKIGTAKAASPLVPSLALANGAVSLGGSPTQPTITISFPAPFAVSITGIVNLGNNSVTFGNVPDIPLTSLALDVTGPSGGKAFNLTSCSPATLTGTFTPQSGTAAKTVKAPVKLNNCASKPTASGSTSGLGKGHPKLKFKVTHGKGAPNVSSVSIGLARGLKFNRSAFVSHRTCTTKNHKRKCTTTTLIKGLGVKGAKPKSVKLKSGRLVITLKKAATSVTVSAAGPLVSETKSLQTKVKKHKAGKLTFTLKVTDAKHTSTTIRLKLAAH